MLENREAVEAEIDKNFKPCFPDATDPEIRSWNEDDKWEEWTLLPVVHPSPASEEGGESEEAVESSSSLTDSEFAEAERQMELARSEREEAGRDCD